MRNARLAELILSLAMSSERAAAITGDLQEQDGSASEFWFYVVHTAVAQAWRQSSFGLAVRGLLVEFWWTLAACGVFLGVLLIAISIAYTLHEAPPAWMDAWAAFLLTNLFVPLQVGKWMARRYPGRELAGSLRLSFTHAAINISAGAICWIAARAGANVSARVSVSQIHFVSWNDDLSTMLQTVLLYLSLYPAMLLVGAAWTRARTTSRNTRISPAPSAPAASDE